MWQNATKLEVTDANRVKVWLAECTIWKARGPTDFATWDNKNYESLEEMPRFYYLGGSQIEVTTVHISEDEEFNWPPDFQ